jgi:hypothetical protein
MGLSDFEYTAAWSVGSLVAFGLLTIGCKQIPAFGASPSFAAHMIVHVFLVCAICYYSLVGRLDWITEQPATLQERMYTFDPSAHKICLLQIALQIYVVASALYTRHPLLMSPVAFAHHLMTGAGMCISLRPFGHSRTGLFFGVTELSTIPLDVIDLFKGFKQLRTQFPRTELVSKIIFALSFLGLRVGLVTHASYGFQSDLYQLYATGDFVTHSLSVLAFSSLANVGIVLLQFYWATLILKGVQKLLAGGGGGKGDKKSGKAA